MRLLAAGRKIAGYKYRVCFGIAFRLSGGSCLLWFFVNSPASSGAFLFDRPCQTQRQKSIRIPFAPEPQSSVFHSDFLASGLLTSCLVAAGPVWVKKFLTGCKVPD